MIAAISGWIRPCALAIPFFIGVHSILALAAQTAFETVHDYYDALGRGDCITASLLRPGYTPESCRKIEKVISRLAVDAKAIGDKQIVFFEVEYEVKGDPARKYFQGHMTLRRDDADWRIISKSVRRGLTIDQYMVALNDLGIWPLDDADTAAPVASDTGNGEESDAVEPAFAFLPDDPAKIPVPSLRPGRSAGDGAEFVPDAPSNDAPSDQPAIATLRERMAPGFPSNGQRTNLEPAAGSFGSDNQADMWRNGGPKYFGSNAIMKACWPDARKLAGRPEEKKTRRTGPGAYLARPERAQPANALAPLPRRLQRSIRRVDTGGKRLVALTFDIGERNNDFAGYDGEIIDYLRKEGIKATHYFGGKWMATHRERAMQLIADPLFEPGNHAWTHGNMRVLTGQDMIDQIQFTQAQYEVILEELRRLPCAQGIGESEFLKIPQQLPSFRYPYGTCSQESLRAANDLGLPAVQWDVVSADPVRTLSPEGLAKGVLRNVRPGSIVIMHANGRGWSTGKALPTIVRELLKRGYQFVTVSELLRAGKPVATDTCFELRPGDNLRYDKIFGRGTGD